MPTSVIGWGLAAGLVALVVGVTTDQPLVGTIVVAAVAAVLTGFGQWRLLHLGERRERPHRYVDVDE